MQKVKFGRLVTDTKTTDINWYVIEEGYAVRKAYRTDSKTQKFVSLSLLPTTNLGMLTADEVHELVWEGARFRFYKFCADLLMKRFFNREEQEKLMRAVYRYSFDKELSFTMVAVPPTEQELCDYEGFGLIDDKECRHNIFIKVNGKELTYVNANTNQTETVPIEEEYKGSYASPYALRPVIQIVLTQEEYDAMKID